MSIYNHSLIKKLEEALLNEADVSIIKAICEDLCKICNISLEQFDTSAPIHYSQTVDLYYNE